MISDEISDENFKEILNDKNTFLNIKSNHIDVQTTSFYSIKINELDDSLRNIIINKVGAYGLCLLKHDDQDIEKYLTIKNLKYINNNYMHMPRYVLNLINSLDEIKYEKLLKIIFQRNFDIKLNKIIAKKNKTNKC